MMSKKYFKKPNGVIIEVMPNHDIKSLEDRFEECDENGNTVKKVKKANKKGSK